MLPRNKGLEHRSELAETFVWLLSKVVEHCIDDPVAMHRLVITDGLNVRLRTTIAFEERNDVVLRPQELQDAFAHRQLDIVRKCHGRYL